MLIRLKGGHVFDMLVQYNVIEERFTTHACGKSYEVLNER